MTGTLYTGSAPRLPPHSAAALTTPSPRPCVLHDGAHDGVHACHPFHVRILHGLLRVLLVRTCTCRTLALSCQRVLCPSSNPTIRSPSNHSFPLLPVCLLSPSTSSSALPHCPRAPQRRSRVVPITFFATSRNSLPTRAIRTGPRAGRREQVVAGVVLAPAGLYLHLLEGVWRETDDRQICRNSFGDVCWTYSQGSRESKVRERMSQ